MNIYIYIHTWVCICMLALKMTWHPNKFILAGHVGHQWPFHWIRQMIRVGMQVNSRKNARGYGALYGGSRPKITTRGRMKQVSKPLPWQHNKPNSVWKPWFLIRSTVFAWIHDGLISWLPGSSCWVIVLSDITSGFEFWILTLLYLDFVRFYNVLHAVSEDDYSPRFGLSSQPTSPVTMYSALSHENARNWPCKNMPPMPGTTR